MQILFVELNYKIAINIENKNKYVINLKKCEPVLSIFNI